jgi:hypothetical protein
MSYQPAGEGQESSVFRIHHCSQVDIYLYTGMLFFRCFARDNWIFNCRGRLRFQRFCSIVCLCFDKKNTFDVFLTFRLFNAAFLQLNKQCIFVWDYFFLCDKKVIITCCLSGMRVVVGCMNTTNTSQIPVFYKKQKKKLIEIFLTLNFRPIFLF